MATTIRPDTKRALQLFRALSDQTRLEIISLLLHGEQCVCEIMSEIGAAQSRLSFHLRVLKDTGLVTDRKEGRWVYYELSRDAFDEIRSVVSEFTPRTRRPAKPAQACCN